MGNNNIYDYVDKSHKASDDEVFCGFVCENCAEGNKETQDGKIVCHGDGKARGKDYTCPYWYDDISSLIS